MSDELDLGREELAERIDAAVDPARASSPFGLYAWRATDPAAEIARSLERSVFAEAFGESPALLQAEYERYESASVFFCVVDHRRRIPAGAIRVIVPGGEGFKSVDDVERFWHVDPRACWREAGTVPDEDRMWDIATLAVGPDYRGAAGQGIVSLALYGGVTSTAVRAGMGWYAAILDRPVLRLLQWRLGRPFERYPGIREASYLGSELSLPVWSNLGTWAERLAAVDESIYEIVFEGRGLEPACSVPDADSLVETATVFEPTRRSGRTGVSSRDNTAPS